MRYVLLGNIGAKWATRQRARVAAAKRQLKRLRIKIESVNYVQGPYDFVDIVDAPNPGAMLAFSIWYANKGLGKITTLPAFDDKAMSAAAGKLR